MNYRALALGVLLPLATGCATLPRRDGGPPASFVKTTSDTRTTRVITVRDGIAKSAAWRILGEVLSADHIVDVKDQQAGFMMTPWETSVARDGVPDVRYRTRVVTRFVGDDWRQLQLRVEANWRTGDEWDVGVDQALLERMASQLEARLSRNGTRPPG